MPEVTPKDEKEFKTLKDRMDFNTIGYKDKQREVSRQKKLVIFKETGEWDGKNKKKCKKTEPWELAKQSKLEKQDKRKVRQDKKAKWKAIEEESGVKKAKKRKAQMSKEDMEELLRDVALCKKLKQKKISNTDFDKEFGIEDSD